MTTGEHLAQALEKDGYIMLMALGVSPDSLKFTASWNTSVRKWLTMYPDAKQRLKQAIIDNIDELVDTPLEDLHFDVEGENNGRDH